MTREDLGRLVAEAPPEALAGLIGDLEAAKAAAWARLVTPAANGSGNGHSEPPPEKWISPEAAAAIAGVPKERIYAWSKGRKWAARPSRRCLRISEQSFRRWLATKA